MKRHRFVCQQWGRIGYTILKSKSRDAILFGDSNECHKQIQVFTSVVKKETEFNGSLPFRYFTLQPSVFSNQRSQNIQDFFVATGNSFKSLFINYQEHSHSFTLPETEFLDDSGGELLRFPHLRHFRFEVSPPQDQSFVRSDGTVLNGVDLFRKIFSAARNMVRLELVIPESSVINVDPYLQVISDGDSTIHSRLADLVLNITLNDKRVNILSSAKFQLKSVRISQQNSDCEATTALDFVKGLTQSLRHLKIDCLNFHEFPTLPNLQILEVLDGGRIHQVVGQHSLPEILDFNFAQTFPKLRTLIFTSYNWNASFLMLFTTTRKGVKSVRELKLPKQIDLTDTSILVSRISKTFPLLAKLEIFLSHESVSCLAEIFAKLSTLEEFSVTFVNWKENKCIDYIITGIKEWICKEIYSLNDMRGLKVARSAASILDLQSNSKLLCNFCVHKIPKNYVIHFQI